MKEFPSKLVPVNHALFKQYKYERCIQYLRQDVYEHVLNSDEEYEDFFNIEDFVSKHSISPESISLMLATICVELENLGWKTKIGRGKTGLWVYPSDKVPKSLPDW